MPPSSSASTSREHENDRNSSSRSATQSGAVQPGGHGATGGRQDRTAGPTRCAVRGLSGDRGPLLPVFLLRPASVRDATNGTPQAAGSGRDDTVGGHRGDRCGGSGRPHGGVHRGHRARRWFAVQRAVVVRRRRHLDSAPAQDHADLPRTDDLGPGRRKRTAGRRQRGRAHRAAGLLRALQPAGALRADRRGRADPREHVSRIVWRRPVLRDRWR